MRINRSMRALVLTGLALLLSSFWILPASALETASNGAGGSVSERSGALSPGAGAVSAGPFSSGSFSEDSPGAALNQNSEKSSGSAAEKSSGSEGSLQDDSQTGEAANAPVVMRQGKELYRAVYATLKKWALAKEEIECQQAAIELLSVYEELFGDTQLPEDTQSTLRTLVRCRLKSLSQTLSVYNKKRGDVQRKAAIAQSRAAKRPANLSLPDGKAVAEGQAFGAQRGKNPVDDNWFGTGSSNNNADCGEDLVELIQNTIRRPTWQANGGNASIYYYRQLRALVVSQTQEGHEEIERLLEALRRAGS